jgi:hypothetical protein
VLIFNRCLDKGKEKDKPVAVRNAKGQQFAGAASCRSCHQAIYDSFIESAHHASSSVASPETIKGSFASNANTFELDSIHKVVMEKNGDVLRQVAYTNGKEERAEPFDIVIGSGKRGQSYLYWKYAGLYQLPVSYFTRLNAWVNSPGFTTKKLFFDRVIEARCLECHTTFAKERFTNEYDPAQIMLGIDCEKCHGAAAEHVDFHTNNPKEQQGKYIISPNGFSRQQKLDACALCHSGTMQSLIPAFSFTPGDTLSGYFTRNAAHIDSSALDVHANQYGLLTASKCFRVSQSMTCGSCHNPHEKERGDLTSYSQKCMSCHTQGSHNFCTVKEPFDAELTGKCVNCHMPVKESRNIMLLTSGKAMPSAQPVRTHLIAVYPGEIGKWMKK